MTLIFAPFMFGRGCIGLTSTVLVMIVVSHPQKT